MPKKVAVRSIECLATSVVKLAAVCGVVAILLPSETFAGNGNGNNGNGNGNGGSNDNRAENGNGRGQEARNLRSANAARANQNALANAAPGSTPAQLNIYRDAVIHSSALVQIQNAAAQDLVRLQSLSAAEIAVQFPNGDYDSHLSSAMSAYQTATAQAQAAAETRDANLAVLTEGQTLSQSDLRALHRMLGL